MKNGQELNSVEQVSQTTWSKRNSKQQTSITLSNWRNCGRAQQRQPSNFKAPQIRSIRIRPRFDSLRKATGQVCSIFSMFSEYQLVWISYIRWILPRTQVPQNSKKIERGASKSGGDDENAQGACTNGDQRVNRSKK